MTVPSGTVTFLFTDIEGSTRLWQQDEAAMRAALERHDELAADRDRGRPRRDVCSRRMGDGFAAAFARPATRCARRSRRSSCAGGESVADGDAASGADGAAHRRGRGRDGDYFGTAVNRAARLMAVGHGGQVLCSAARPRCSATGVVLVDLGEHRLRDLDRPMHVFQVGDGTFPPLRSIGRAAGEPAGR